MAFRKGTSCKNCSQAWGRQKHTVLTSFVIVAECRFNYIVLETSKLEHLNTLMLISCHISITVYVSCLFIMLLIFC